MYRNVHLRLILDQMIPSADNQPIVIHFFSLTKKKKGNESNCHNCHYSARPARAVSNQHQITFIFLINRCFTCRVKKSVSS